MTNLRIHNMCTLQGLHEFASLDEIHDLLALDEIHKLKYEMWKALDMHIPNNF